jgi:hypothetical protein
LHDFIVNNLLKNIELMKSSLIKTTLIALLVAVSGLFSACTEPETLAQFDVTFKEAGPGSITLIATVPGATQVAYMC